MTAVLRLTFAFTAAATLAALGACGDNQSASTGASSAPLVVHVGQPLALQGINGQRIAVEVTRILDPAEAAGPPGPAHGDRYIAVGLRLDNIGSVGYGDAPDNDVKVFDAQGNSFIPDFNSTTAGPVFPGNRVELAAGSSTSGFITFQLPASMPVAKIDFTTDSGFGQTGEWLVP